MPKTFDFKGRVWKNEGRGGWLYVYVEKFISSEIREIMKNAPKDTTKKTGFGFIPLQATIGRSTWDTAIFPNKDRKYLLAIKQSIARVEHVKETDIVDVRLEVTEPKA